MWDKDMSLTDVLCKKALPQEKLPKKLWMTAKPMLQWPQQI